ncbi:MAG: glucose-1-phosphate thymidylyltransferase [Nitrospinota bacterium]
MLKIEDMFDHLGEFRHKVIFDGAGYYWEVIGKINKYIKDWFKEVEKAIYPKMIIEGISLQEVRDEKDNLIDKVLYVGREVKIRSELFLKEMGIFIGSGTVLEPTAVIKSPAIIGNDCEVRQGAYFRGNVIVGDKSIIGHTTEIKNSILMNHSEAGHFAYIGDSIVGSYVNLGAGTKLANLQFRTLEEKRSGRINTIKIQTEGRVIDTGIKKFGAILGDNVEIGCNAVISPGVIIGKNSWVYPNLTVKKGFYSPNLVIKSDIRNVTLQKTVKG